MAARTRPRSSTQCHSTGVGRDDREAQQRCRLAVVSQQQCWRRRRRQPAAAAAAAVRTEPCSSGCCCCFSSLSSSLRPEAAARRAGTVGTWSGVLAAGSAASMPCRRRRATRRVGWRMCECCLLIRPTTAAASLGPQRPRCGSIWGCWLAGGLHSWQRQFLTAHTHCCRGRGAQIVRVLTVQSVPLPGRQAGRTPSPAGRPRIAARICVHGIRAGTAPRAGEQQQQWCSSGGGGGATGRA